MLNGTKMWISMAAESDIVMVQAVTDAEKRQRGGITMFLVERRNPGMHVEEPSLKTWLGPRAAQNVIRFEFCRVPEEDVLGEVGKNFSLGQKWLTIHDRLLRGPYALGKMQRALDMSNFLDAVGQALGYSLRWRNTFRGGATAASAAAAPEMSADWTASIVKRWCPVGSPRRLLTRCDLILRPLAHVLQLTCRYFMF